MMYVVISILIFIFCNDFNNRHLYFLKEICSFILLLMQINKNSVMYLYKYNFLKTRTVIKIWLQNGY